MKDKGAITMRFMMMVKHAEQQGLPPKELMDAIAILAEEDVKAGHMIGSGGFAQCELKSKEEAVKGAVRFMELHRKYWPGWEGETEIRQIFGPEDFAQHVRELAGT